jgi:hypothetical protein
MQAQKFSCPPAFNRTIAADPGVEPELYCSTPRPVVDSHSTRKQRIWCANIMVGFLAIAYYNWTPSGEGGVLPNYYAVLFLIAPVILGLGWLSIENELRRKREILRDGCALRATVRTYKALTQSEPEYVQLVYCYSDPRPDGSPLRRHLTLTKSDAQRFGGFPVGTQFTVLVSEQNPDSATPYFQINEVTVPGATIFRITPPLSKGGERIGAL